MPISQIKKQFKSLLETLFNIQDMIYLVYTVCNLLSLVSMFISFFFFCFLSLPKAITENYAQV